MFRLAPSPVERRATADLVRWARPLERCALTYPASYGRGRWLHSVVAELLMARPSAKFVHVPQDPDRIERVILELASLAGADAQAAVAHQLRLEPETLTSTLEVLEEVAPGSEFIVDGWSALRSTEEMYEAGHALAPRIASFREWLAKHAWVVADNELDAPANFASYPVQPPNADALPAELLNGGTFKRPDLWKRFAPDVTAYDAALAILALDEKPDGPVEAPAWKLRDHVVRRLPDNARDLLYLLGVHGRPLASELIASLEIDSAATDLLTRLGLCHIVPAGLLLDPGWSAWCHDDLGDRGPAVHQQLAMTFAALVCPSDPSVDRGAIAVLEAHRHYVGAQDYEMARRFARYSAASLMEEAKRRSLQGHYGEASRLYQGILDLSDKGEIPLGSRLRSYATHYFHFNRSKTNAESLKETERGYVESLKAWPENALFWSRLIRARFYRDASAEALSTITEAKAAVPEHYEKEVVLIARTVRGLLAKNYSKEGRNSRHLVDAVLVWGDYDPDTGFARGVAEKLERALAAGWETSELALPGNDALVFSYPQRICITGSADFWVAELVDLRCNRRGATARDALVNLTRGVRDNAKAFLATLTHTLDAQARLQKQILLGAIDVVASRIDAPALSEVWVLGDAVRDPDGLLWIKASGSRNASFAVAESLSTTLVVGDIPYLALVKTGPSGVPIGPVVELKPAYGSAEQAWEAWVKKSRDVG